MGIHDRSQLPTAILGVSTACLSLLLLTIPAAVLAHGGHGDEFHTEAASQTADSIQVDGETAQRMGIKVEQIQRQRLAVGIKTTGQIETLPNQKVKVTAPLNSTVVELLVKPGDFVNKGQTVAILSSPELAQLRVTSAEKRAEAQADLQEAEADLQLAKANYARQQQLVAADIRQAQSQMAFAQEQYDRDRELQAAGAIPRRQMQESETKLTEARAIAAKATSRLPALEAQAQLKRAQSSVEVAQSRLRLSSAGYEARLQQLGSRANAKGQIAVAAPIAGTVADRDITLGESVEEAGEPIMTILNDSRVFATANIYEKDLGKVKTGQQIRVQVASLPNRTFSGQISLIGSTVGDTRVVPVQAELNNSSQLLKPGMFAELEVLTTQTPTEVLTIPHAAVVEANGRQLVYVQNGNAYEPVEVTLGQLSGDTVEVKSGLFEGDRLVTQGAMQLYAQSLRGGEGREARDEGREARDEGREAIGDRGFKLPWWVVIPVGGAIAAGAFWLGRRTRPVSRQPSVGTSHELPLLQSASVGDGHEAISNKSPSP